MKILHLLQHLNIVLFISVSITNIIQVIVTKLMPEASLNKLIYKQVKKKQLLYNVLTFTKKKELLLDVIKEG